MVLCRSTNTLKALKKWEFANHPLGGWSVALQQAITKQPDISLHPYMQISFREVLCQHTRRGLTKRPTFTLLHKIHDLFVFAQSYRVQMKRVIDTALLLFWLTTGCIYGVENNPPRSNVQREPNRCWHRLTSGKPFPTLSRICNGKH